MPTNVVYIWAGVKAVAGRGAELSLLLLRSLRCKDSSLTADRLSDTGHIRGEGVVFFVLFLLTSAQPFSQKASQSSLFSSKSAFIFSLQKEQLDTVVRPFGSITDIRFNTQHKVDKILNIKHMRHLRKPTFYIPVFFFFSFFFPGPHR